MGQEVKIIIIIIDFNKGVFYAAASNVTIISSIFDNNHANVDGGAFKIDSGGTLIMQDC